MKLTKRVIDYIDSKSGSKILKLYGNTTIRLFFLNWQYSPLGVPGTELKVEKELNSIKKESKL